MFIFVLLINLVIVPVADKHFIFELSHFMTFSQFLQLGSLYAKREAADPGNSWVASVDNKYNTFRIITDVTF